MRRQFIQRSLIAVSFVFLNTVSAAFAGGDSPGATATRGASADASASRVSVEAGVSRVSVEASAAPALSQKDFPSSTPLEQAPREVSQAVGLSARVSQNQITSDLDGKSSGYVLIELNADTRGKFHLYDDKFLVWSEPADASGAAAWKIEIVQKPTPHQFMDPTSHSLRTGYRGDSPFVIKATLPGTIAHPLPHDFRLPVVVGFQACSDRVCLLPIAIRIPMPLTEIAPPAEKSLVEKFQATVSGQLGSGGISFTTLLAIFLAGLITAFTPCVYPLYPITLGLFSRWSSNSKIPSFLLAVTYCAGIVLSYSVLGLVSVATGSLFGSLTQTPAFLIGMGVFILLSALVFSGMVNIPIFDRMQGLLAKPLSESTSSAGLLGQAALMGASLGVVASPCVGPVLVVILAWVGTQTQQSSAAYLEGFGYLAFFGAGMALPFLVLGHMILRMGKNPRLGKYTPYFKNIGTVLMVAASLFFLIPGVQLLTATTPHKVSYPVKTLDVWKKDKPTVIDFRADWCVACVELENETFSHPEIAGHFERDEWDMVRVDMTTMDDSKRQIAKDYEVVGLPTVLLVDGNGRVCKSLKLIGFEGPQDFLKRMRHAMQGCKQ